MEHNRGNDHNKNKKPEGERPKGGYFTPLMIALVLVLLFWMASPVASHLIGRLELVTNEELDREVSEWKR